MNATTRNLVTFCRTGAGVALLLVTGCSAPPPGGGPDAGPDADAGAIVGDPFLWGTEAGLHVASAANPPAAVSSAIAVIRDALALGVVKLRLVSQVGTPDPNVCLPLPGGGCTALNLDETVALIRANGWSLLPMISIPETIPINGAAIDTYVDFVDWFVSRYRVDGQIRHVELVNAPMFAWRGTPAQLLELQNKTYDRLKARHPGVLVGTPGFEYFFDSASALQAKGSAEIELFLTGANGARFDFWAFHGYPTLEGQPPNATHHPPSRTPTVNPYANVAGTLEIRRRLDANGWADRPIIDTEHTGTVPAGVALTLDSDALDAAYMVQELVLKRALRDASGLVVEGALPLKIRPRGSAGEDAWGSLNPDGSMTRTVRAVAVLLHQLRGAAHVARVSGGFDREDLVWVEKFRTETGELYVYFKPFVFRAGQRLALDGQTLTASLDLGRTPRAVRQLDALGVAQPRAAEQTISLEATNTPGYLEVEY
jgi:hypothetical protein